MTLSSKGRRKPRDAEILLLMTWQKGAWPRDASCQEAKPGNSSRSAGIHLGQGLKMDCEPVLEVCRSLKSAYCGVTVAKNTLVCMWPCSHGGDPSILTHLSAEWGMPWKSRTSSGWRS